ncbi:adenylate cyclase [Bradyrhizobium sp. LM6.11]
MTKTACLRHDRTMHLSPTLAWLVDAAADSAGADRLLMELGAHLVADGVPLAAGSLTLEVPHPLIAKRTWLWRAESGRVIEALGFAPGGLAPDTPNDAGRRWLRDIADGEVHEDAVGPPDGPLLGWIGPRPFTADEIEQLRQAARFAATPLAVLAVRATLRATLDAYLGKRSAERVLASPLRRDLGETIQAALLYADLRNFTLLSETTPPADVIAALDAWFDRIAGAVHAFGGEVLKFIGDGVLAIFPVVEASSAPRVRCGSACRERSRSRDGVSQRGAPCPRSAAARVRRGAASRRDAVAQYRRRQPARFHGDRSRRQSRQPPRRIV